MDNQNSPEECFIEVSNENESFELVMCDNEDQERTQFKDFEECSIFDPALIINSRDDATCSNDSLKPRKVSKSAKGNEFTTNTDTSTADSSNNSSSSSSSSSNNNSGNKSKSIKRKNGSSSTSNSSAKK